ncbi:MAG TPA: RtcB family protein, partial [Fimbriimonadaceae bacterium]|nr:RtcB family protein [Fimbriimonadaceae bacterium]
MATHNINGIPVWGDPAFEDAVAQIKMVSDHGAEKVALMADHHVGYSMPIGGVAAYRVHVSPSGVGYDIACGNKAILTDMPATELKRKIHVIMDDIASKISFGIGRKNQEEVDHDLFDDLAWKLYPAIQLKDKARAQLGTVGSGNHYVDLFVDELERVWIGVHFGSRGLGHGIASHFIEAGGGGTGMHSPPVLLHQDSNLGSEYIEQMRLAGLYAYAGRDWVCQKVAKI